MSSSFSWLGDVPTVAAACESGLQAVLFDAGNTLAHMDFELLSSLLPQNPADAASRLSGADIRAAEARARVDLSEHIGGRSSDQAMEGRETLELYLGMVIHQLGMSADRDQLRVMLERFGAANAQQSLWRVPRPGDRAVLERLRSRGLKLAVVSNSNGHVHERIEEVKLLDLMDLVVDSGIEGIEKPDPEIFRRTLERLGSLSPSRVVHVGDLAVSDVLGAARAGIAPVLLDPLGDHRRRGWRWAAIDDLDELEALLEDPHSSMK